MRLISFLNKLDDSENSPHFVIGFNSYKDNAYYTEWYENRDSLLAQPNATLIRDISCFWFNAKVNTICIELRYKR